MRFFCSWFFWFCKNEFFFGGDKDFWVFCFFCLVWLIWFFLKFGFFFILIMGCLNFSWKYCWYGLVVLVLVVVVLILFEKDLVLIINIVVVFLLFMIMVVFLYFKWIGKVCKKSGMLFILFGLLFFLFLFVLEVDDRKLLCFFFWVFDWLFWVVKCFVDGFLDVFDCCDWCWCKWEGGLVGIFLLFNLWCILFINFLEFERLVIIEL